MSIEQNIEDRKWFEEMEKTVGTRFWELCREKLDKETVDPTDMTEEEALAFGRTRIPIDMFEGTQIQQIKTKHLERIADQLPWLKKLNQYLKHRKD